MFRFLPVLPALVCLFVWTSRATAQNFTVSVTHGQTALGKDRTSYQPAVVNSSYAIPAWGKTEDESSLTITFNPQNIFRLLPNSEAEVTTGGESDSNSAWHRVVSLKIGEAEFNHHAGATPAVQLDCQTPTAVCGAVGTKYTVNATTGKYTVSDGRISVHSDQEGALRMQGIHEGSVVYNPGRENTYSHGNFSGTVDLNGASYSASGTTFTVAKILGDPTETAVHIESGRLGSYGPGDYLSTGGALEPVKPGSKAATIHPQYLLAAEREGALSVEKAAYRAANRTPPAEVAQLAAAATEATRLRNELFNRGTIQETAKKVTETVIENTVRNAAEAAARNAATSSMRGGR